jgi:CDP-diglyceride synthetase
MVYERVFRVHQWVSFVLYSVTFVITILSFKKGIVKYQFEQLTWTLLTIIMVVCQMNLAVYNIFEGLFWFLLPCSLVIANDCFAYFCGFAFGGKLLKDENGRSNFSFMRMGADLRNRLCRKQACISSFPFAKQDMGR